MANSSFRIAQGHGPHLYWMELDRDNRMYECAVLRRNPDGSAAVIRIQDLDGIDRHRLQEILMQPRAAQFPLFEILANRTLTNGINALEYFHQFVKMVSVDGTVFDPRAGVTVVGSVDLEKEKEKEAAAEK